MKTNQLIMIRTIISVYAKSYVEYIKTESVCVCVNCRFYSVKPGGMHSNHLALKS